MGGVSVTAPMCKVCEKVHWPRQPHVWGKESEPKECAGCATLTRTVEARDALIDELRAEIGVLRGRVTSVTHPAKPVTNGVTPVTVVTKKVRNTVTAPVTPVTGVTHNKVTEKSTSPERLAYLREYAKKHRAEAKAKQ